MAMKDFNLPEPIAAVLPDDPFEQLDIARKVTSIALATRVSKLESDSSMLRETIAEKDDLISELRAKVESLDASLADLSRSLAQAHEEKAKLLEENASLSNTVKKLNRDVSRLEVFKKTLMQSLNEEEGSSQSGVSKVVPTKLSEGNFSTGPNLGEEDAAHPTLKSETGSSISDDGGSYDTDASKLDMQYNLRLSSLNTTPKLTPPGSPPRFTAVLSPPTLSTPAHPMRHSIAISSRRSLSEDRSSVFSSMPSNNQNLMTSPFDSGSQTGRTRVDGKEFFRQVRSRLSGEQFSSFLANVKELNSHRQTREETLHKAEEIFGPDNKDLYAIFEGLITRNLH